MVTSDTSNRELREKLSLGANQLGIELEHQHLDALEHFLSLLHKWNRVYNLTAVRSMHEMVGRHILDSLSVLPYLPDNPLLDGQAVDTKPTGAKSADAKFPDANSLDTNSADAKSLLESEVFDVLDVGTGAGLPVIPLAIFCPDLRFLSVESAGKKTRFQQQALLELGLTNVQVEQSRIEDVDSKATTVISRAFTAPEKFIAAIEKNCVEQSRVIIMLGLKEKMPGTLNAGFTLSELNRVNVPGCESARHIALCEKIRHL